MPIFTIGINTKNEEIQDLIQEREHMQKTISDLQAKLVAADLDKHRQDS